MCKKMIFLAMYLNLMKSLTFGFAIDNNEMINQWLQSFNAVSAPLKQWFVESAQHQNQGETAEAPLTRNEQSVSEIRQNSAVNNETPVPISHVLETLQTEINKADNNEKNYYKGLLTELEQVFAQKSRYARVFFNKTWHLIDLGLYGSSQRTRDASTLNSMLKPLRDLIKWLYKNVVDLLTWNIATDEDEDEEHHNKPAEHKEEGVKVTTKVGEKGEDIHKVTHRFESDPFTVKFNMDITCRILDDSKNPNNPEKSNSHHESEVKMPGSKDKDTKPTPTSPNKGVESGPSNIRKDGDVDKTDKGEPSTDDEVGAYLLNPKGGSDSKKTIGEEKKPEKLEGNPVHRELITNPPPSDQKKPPSDDKAEDIDRGPGYRHPETNPHMMRRSGYDPPETNPLMRPRGYHHPETNPHMRPRAYDHPETNQYMQKS